jgi:hypothetical protein
MFCYFHLDFIDRFAKYEFDIVQDASDGHKRTHITNGLSIIGSRNQ